MFVIVDTTRTVHFGEPTDFQKEAFTRVLKGFISMGSATFPVKAPVSFLFQNVFKNYYKYFPTAINACLEFVRVPLALFFTYFTCYHFLIQIFFEFGYLYSPIRIRNKNRSFSVLIRSLVISLSIIKNINEITL